MESDHEYQHGAINTDNNVNMPKTNDSSPYKLYFLISGLSVYFS
jgi:hypothetical protein